MAAYTSTTSGNWTQSATWGGAGVPGDGDTVTIATGTTVTVDQNTTVGTNPADQTTMVVTINSPTGKLMIGSGITLTVKGNVYANAGASNNIQSGIVWSAGSNFVFGSHNVAGGWVLKCGQYNTYATSGTSAGSMAYLGTATGSTTNGCLTSAMRKHRELLQRQLYAVPAAWLEFGRCHGRHIPVDGGKWGDIRDILELHVRHLRTNHIQLA